MMAEHGTYIRRGKEKREDFVESQIGCYLQHRRQKVLAGMAGKLSKSAF
jgi:hypothetical protein